MLVFLSPWQCSTSLENNLKNSSRSRILYSTSLCTHSLSVQFLIIALPKGKERKYNYIVSNLRRLFYNEAPCRLLDFTAAGQATFWTCRLQRGFLRAVPASGYQLIASSQLLLTTQQLPSLPSNSQLADAFFVKRDRYFGEQTTPRSEL